MKVPSSHRIDVEPRTSFVSRRRPGRVLRDTDLEDHYLDGRTLDCTGREGATLRQMREGPPVSQSVST